MLKHKCPKCGNELGYKWKSSLYNKDYSCPKCRAKLEVTNYVTLAMLVSFLLGLLLTDYITPLVGTFYKYPQVTKGVVTFFSIILIWLVVSAIMPRQLRIKAKKK